ncbi:hypothetical protein [Metallosphaera javensis (ex Sakai et al. 2022)]|uniref:hypothetical protein n=1 Tax=Metallosphaera javensis (ex Sakai et al. 2022) TaxID=2775498 RepID=UPI00258CB34D|nr:MAG: hypothetical protein MjAS7_1964 [Metallosphaera javensis (ex Sakai et al. 2022)]
MTEQRERNLERMDRAFKVLFIVGFILELVVAALVTGNTATKPLTAQQVAAVGIIPVILLVSATVVYEQFPYSVLGKPKEEKQKEVKARS